MPELLEVRIGSKLHVWDPRNPQRCRCGWKPTAERLLWDEHITEIVQARMDRDGPGRPGRQLPSVEDQLLEIGKELGGFEPAGSETAKNAARVIAIAGIFPERIDKHNVVRAVTLERLDSSSVFEVDITVGLAWLSPRSSGTIGVSIHRAPPGSAADFVLGPVLGVTPDPIPAGSVFELNLATGRVVLAEWRDFLMGREAGVRLARLWKGGWDEAPPIEAWEDHCDDGSCGPDCELAAYGYFFCRGCLDHHRNPVGVPCPVDLSIIRTETEVES